MLNPFFSLSIIIFFLGFAIFYVAPLYGEINTQRADLQVLNESAKDTEKIQQVINQTLKSLNSVDPMVIKRLETFIPETIDEVRFVNDIQGVGVKNGLAVSNIKIEDKAKEMNVGSAGKGSTPVALEPLSLSAKNAGSAAQKNKYVTTKITFDVIASYEGFRLLVNDLEKSLGLINITELSFQEYKEGKVVASKAVREGAPIPLYAFKVGVETYSLK
ncbi:MAG: hypothetical protein AAB628_03310 [Patescibacteria group bacterium]